MTERDNIQAGGGGVPPGRDWRWAAFVAAVVLALIVAVWLDRPQPADRSPDASGASSPSPRLTSAELLELTPRQVTGAEFVSSAACRDCHPRQHESWSETYHRTMTQLATPETVVADFDDVELTSRGRWYRLQKKDDAFWVTMRDPEWEARQRQLGRGPGAAAAPLITKPIVMTTGSHHMQGYWFPSGRGGNELLQLPFYYHFGEQRWLPREDVFLQPPRKEPQLLNWGAVCIKCHSVGGVPGGIPTQTALDSQVAELGIACEACHGPGAEHVRLHQAEDLLSGPAAATDPIVNPARVSAKKQSEICGQCHSEFNPTPPQLRSFWSAGIGYRAGGDLQQTHQVVRYQGPVYQQNESDFQHTFWNDGTCRVGGDELNALIASPCYERGELSCLSCHSLHDSDPNDLLASGMDGNQACQQCHQEPRFNERLAEHTRHSPQSSGSLCYNCHMPHTTYALMTAMRSHRVTSPQVEPVVGGGSPNACNLCHLDQTLDWTSGRLSSWYGQPPVTLSEDERQVSASLIWLLRGDAMQRAVTAWHMRWRPAREASGDRWQAPFLSRLLEDPYAAVRYQAVKALQSSPGLEDLKADFIAAPDELKAAQQRALAAWREGSRDVPAERRRRVLLDDALQVREQTVQRLLDHRDDTPVRIPE